MIKTIRLILTFYQSFAFASLVITMSCVSMMYAFGIDTFTMLFWFKLITFGLIFYYIQHLKKDDLYYYKNLGLTKRFLWGWALTIDVMLFLIFMLITLKIR